MTDEKNSVSTGASNSGETTDSFFQNAFKDAPLAYNRFDADGRVTAVNRRFCELLGYDSEEACKMSIWDYRASDSPDGPERLEQMRRGEAVHGVEVELLRKDGKTIWVELHAHPILDESGDVVAGRAMIVDITERKRAQQKLADSERRYRRLVNLVPLGLLIHVDGIIRWGNQTAKDLLCIGGESSLAGTRILDVVEAGEREEASRRIQSLLSDNVEILEPREVELNPVSGETFFANVTATTCDFDGELAVMVVFRDVTQEKKLRERSKKADRLDSVSRLAGGIAHDFNNILAVLSSNLSIAQRFHELNEDLAELLGDCDKAVDQGRSLTDQLQTFARGDAPLLTPHGLNNMVEKSVKFALRGTNVESQFELSDDLWTVEINEGRINQVLNNLAINADQATPDGGLLEVKTENITLTDHHRDVPLPPGDYVRLTFADDGVGIPADDLDQIFDAFYSTKASGSGLGLSTAYSILQQHDGLLSVESAEGGGTTFEMYLPRSTAARATSPTSESIIEGTGRILVMDDDEKVLSTVRNMLEQLGYAVETVTDVATTLAAYREAVAQDQPFDAVILDITIKGGPGGRQAITELQKIDPNVVAVGTSGYASDDLEEAYDEYGFDGFLPKPYRVELLSEVLDELLNQ